MSRIAAAEGVSLDASSLKIAITARITRAEASARFSEARQLDLIAAYADAISVRLQTALQRPLTQLEGQQGATALAILIDKWRLIEGEATSRTETAAQGARERLAARLDELAQRRAAAGS